MAMCFISALISKGGVSGTNVRHPLIAAERPCSYLAIHNFRKIKCTT
jgi:hypothetical protein